MKDVNIDVYVHQILAWIRVLRQCNEPTTGATHWLAPAETEGRRHVAEVGAMWDSRSSTS